MGWPLKKAWGCPQARGGVRRKEGWVSEKPDWGSQLTTGLWLPGFPGRGMRDMKGKFLQEKKTFLRFLFPSSLISDPSFLAESWRTFWKGGGVECHLIIRRQQSQQGCTLWGPLRQPSSLLLEGWCQTAPVLKIVHQEEADSTVRLPYLPESLQWINKNINECLNE